MKDRAGHLTRLAAAQGKMAEILEKRLVGVEISVHTYQNLIERLSKSMSGTEASLLTFQTAALKRLAAAEAGLAACKAEAGEIRLKLLATRGREKTLAMRAAVIRRADERKALETESLESALQLISKACRKADALE